MTRHRLDVFSLLAGLFFTTVAILALTGGWSFSVGPWLWPSILIASGVIVLLALVASARDRDDAGEPAGPDDAVLPHHRDPVMAAARAEAEAADPFAETAPMPAASDAPDGDDG